MMEGVSIIICCYNSASRLPQTLEHLANQNVADNIKWEVLIVDNNSTDNTDAIATELWQEYGQPVTLQIIEERQAGLSFARHTGFTNANYEYCLFCDDDNWLGQNYINIVYDIMQRDQRIGVLGGIGEAVCEVKPPVWFEDNQKDYAIGAQSICEGDVTDTRGFVYGAGAVFRRSVFVELVRAGFRSLLSDRKGATLSSGGDSELCYNYVLRGYKIYYTPRLKFQHFIPASRLTTGYYFRLVEGIRHSNVVLTLYRYKISQNDILNKRFLWFRELMYLARQRFKTKDALRFKDTVAYALIINRHAFIRTCKYLKSV